MAKRNPKCEVYPSPANGRWYFRMKGGNGEIQCPSQGYGSKRGALDGFRRLQHNVAIAEVVVVLE
jgi:uncharacterized protein YegP (UPF0339 family)